MCFKKNKNNKHLTKHVSDQDNQHNNGPHQEQIFDNPSALCLALWAKNRIRLGGGGEGGGRTDAPNRLFMKEVLHSDSIKNKTNKRKQKILSDLLCLKSSRSKYNASTINYLLVFFFFYTYT